MKKTTKVFFIFYLISTDRSDNVSSECCTSGINNIIPAYFPLLFLVTKQAISATRVRNATTHMIPMSQLVENLSCTPAESANTLISISPQAEK